MPSSDRKVRVYEELAEWEHDNGSAQARDRFLILAADAAQTAGLTDEAERLRARLLEHNPHHMLKPYASLADALKSSEVYSYVADLRGNHPIEEAEQQLSSLRKEGKRPASTDLAGSPPATSPPSLPADEGETWRDEPSRSPGPEGAPLFSSLRDAGEPAPLSPPLRPTPLPEPAPSPVADLEPGPEDEEDEAVETAAGVGPWLSDFLFFLTLLLGVVLIGYTAARPFLQIPDAPLWK
jgi:hypothetical protein